MKFGLCESELFIIINKVVIPLEQKGAIIWCFGSRARGDFKKFSDIDLMVEAKIDLAKEISQISDELIESQIPFKVDIIELSKFAESYLKNFEQEKIRFEK